MRSCLSRPVVVFLDDEGAWLDAVRRLLRREPFILRTTSCPEEALSWIEAGEVDLFLSDYRLIGTSGLRVLQEVWQKSPRTTRVIVTGYPDLNVVFQRADDRIHHWLTKPWNDEDLRTTIRRFLGLEKTCDEKRSNS